MESSNKPSTAKNLEYIRSLPVASPTTTESSLFTVAIFSSPSSLPKTFHFITPSFLYLILSDHPIVNNRGKLMIMGPEKDTLTISLLKAIDEANHTINALVEADKDVVGRLEHVTSTLTDRLSAMNEFMEANNHTLLNKVTNNINNNRAIDLGESSFNIDQATDALLKGITKLDQVTNNMKTLNDAILKSIATVDQVTNNINNYRATDFESGAATENRGWWVKIKEKAWEKIFDVVLHVGVALGIKYGLEKKQ